MSRLVFFNHAIMPSINQGIQSGHAAVELLLKYNQTDYPEQNKLVQEWAWQHKTFVLLNGGMTSDLHHIKRLLKESTNLPWAEFREPDYGNMVTSLAVLVPDDYHVIPGCKGYTFFEILRNSKLAK